MTCSCIVRINALLRPRNLTLRVQWRCGPRVAVPTMRLRRWRRYRGIHIVARYCPFCGQRYERGRPDLKAVT